MFYGKHVVQGPDTVFMPMAMLMLFVFSAAVTSGLVLGRPIMWYLDGKKKEAIHLLVSTLSIFFVLLISAVLLIIKK
jgi:uncharacterized membrane protein